VWPVIHGTVLKCSARWGNGGDKKGDLLERKLKARKDLPGGNLPSVMVKGEEGIGVIRAGLRGRRLRQGKNSTRMCRGEKVLLRNGEMGRNSLSPQPGGKKGRKVNPRKEERWADLLNKKHI